MRCFLISPIRQSVTEIDIPGGYESIRDILAKFDPSYSGTFDVRVLAHEEDSGVEETLYLDDSGCLEAGRPVFQLLDQDGAVGLSIAGTALLIGTDREGESCGSQATISGLTACIRWTGLETTGEFGPTQERENAPMPWGGTGFEIIGGQPIFRERQAQDSTPLPERP